MQSNIHVRQSITKSASRPVKVNLRHLILAVTYAVFILFPHAVWFLVDRICRSLQTSAMFQFTMLFLPTAKACKFHVDVFLLPSISVSIFFLVFSFQEKKQMLLDIIVPFIERGLLTGLRPEAVYAIARQNLHSLLVVVVLSVVSKRRSPAAAFLIYLSSDWFSRSNTSIMPHETISNACLVSSRTRSQNWLLSVYDGKKVCLRRHINVLERKFEEEGINDWITKKDCLSFFVFTTASSLVFNTDFSLKNTFRQFFVETSNISFLTVSLQTVCFRCNSWTFFSSCRVTVTVNSTELEQLGVDAKISHFSEPSSSSFCFCQQKRGDNFVIDVDASATPILFFVKGHSEEDLLLFSEYTLDILTDSHDNLRENRRREWLHYINCVRSWEYLLEKYCCCFNDMTDDQQKWVEFSRRKIQVIGYASFYGDMTEGLTSVY